MAKMLFVRKIKKYHGQTITGITENRTNLNLNFKNELQEKAATENPEGFINNVVNDLIAKGQYIQFNYYVKSGNPYKKQAYLNGKYYLTINKDNIKAFEKDYNFFKGLGISENEIKRVLKIIYLIN